MLNRNFLVAVACFGCLVPFASAQTPGGGGGFHERYFPPPITPYPPPPSPFADAVFGAMVVGEFTGDLGLDAVVMDDGEPSLLMSPEVFITNIANVYPNQVAGNDIATYRYAGATHDVLLLAGANGIQKLDYSGPTGQPWTATTLVSGTNPGITLDGSSAWGGARVVRTGSFGWTSATDIVGLAGSSNPSKVLTLLASPAGGFLAGAGLMTGGAAYGLEVLDWDNNSNGLDEIAVVTSLGIEVWGTTAGSFKDGYPWTAGPILIAVLHDGVPASQGGGDRIAFVVTDEYEEQYLGVFDRFGVEGIEDEDLYPLGAAGIVTATARDTDGDGDEDLFLTSTAHPAFLVMENLSPAANTFDIFDEDHIRWEYFGDEDRDPSVNEAGLAIGDFDRDTDLDILAPAQGDGTVDGRVHLLRNELVDHRQWLVEVAYSVFYVDLTVTPPTDTLQFDLDPPETLLTGTGLTPRLKVTVWRTPDHEEHTEAEVFVPVQYLDPDVYLDPEGPLFEFATGETEAYEYSAIHTVVIRQVLLDGGGNIVDQRPAAILVNASEENYAEIIGQQGSEFGLLRGNSVYSVIGQHPDGRTGGGTSGGPAIPPPPEQPDPRPDPEP